jgi:hypothetical protein
MTIVELKLLLRSLDDVTFFYDRRISLWTLVRDSGTDYFTKETIIRMGKEKFLQTYIV